MKEKGRTERRVREGREGEYKGGKEGMKEEGRTEREKVGERE